jgi:hypothetical protein
VDVRVLQLIYALPQDAGGFFVGQQVDAYIPAKPAPAPAPAAPQGAQGEVSRSIRFPPRPARSPAARRPLRLRHTAPAPKQRAAARLLHAPAQAPRAGRLVAAPARGSPRSPGWSRPRSRRARSCRRRRPHRAGPCGPARHGSRAAAGAQRLGRVTYNRTATEQFGFQFPAEAARGRGRRSIASASSTAPAWREAGMPTCSDGWRRRAPPPSASTPRGSTPRRCA